MPFSDITGLTSSNTFSDLFLKNNEMITRLNELDIGYITAGTGVTLSSIGSTGGVTLSVDLSSLATNLYINNTSVTITGSLPSGLTLGGIVGTTYDAAGPGYTLVNNLSLDSSNKFIGFITEVGASSWKISTSGIFQTVGSVVLTSNTLYYLNFDGSITATVPTTVGRVIKPVLYTFGDLSAGYQYGLIINGQGTVIPDPTTASVKSSSRSIAEIYGGGLSAGNPVYYDVAGSTWSKSIANDYAKAEVFGIVESITGLTATVVMHGSIKLPTTETYSVCDGGSGGNDIYFLSGTTAGAIQNCGPTASGSIVKPLYTVAPHSLSGITFTGIVVNYIGYRNN